METFFGKKRNRPRQSSISAQDTSERSFRPQSYASLGTNRSESTRSSRYGSSLSPIDSHPHLSSLSQSFHKHVVGDEFYFPRPENDEEIEALFMNIMRQRDLGDMPHLSIDQKWNIVYNDEQIRWKEERQREEQTRRQTETGQAAAVADGTPEWYIKKFLDKTITAKHASSLQVSLRSKEVEYVHRNLLMYMLLTLCSDGFASSSHYRVHLCWHRPCIISVRRVSSGRSAPGSELHFFTILLRLGGPMTMNWSMRFQNVCGRSFRARYVAYHFVSSPRGSPDYSTLLRRLSVIITSFCK